MTALGQKRTSPPYLAMSALPPKADIAAFLISALRASNRYWAHKPLPLRWRCSSNCGIARRAHAFPCHQRRTRPPKRPPSILPVALSHFQAALGSELLGVYLIGSLAHGGFSRRYSDIDMALVTEAGISPQTLDHVRSQTAAMSSDWGSFPCSGPTGSSVSADSLHWIVSIISIMRLY